MNFDKVRLRTIPAVVAEQIEIAIQLGRFAVGGRLPPEAKLAAEMGVSRPSIREALSALRAAGLIESRKGSGSYVLRAPSMKRENQNCAVQEHRNRYLSVVQARAALEPPIAAMAAEQSGKQDLLDLNRIIKGMYRLAQSGDVNGYLDVDKAFHLAVVRAAQNELVLEVIAPLVGYMDQSLYRVFTRHHYLTGASEHKRVVDMHAEVCTRIGEADPPKAYASMEKLWHQTREIWEA